MGIKIQESQSGSAPDSPRVPAEHSKRPDSLGCFLFATAESSLRHDHSPRRWGLCSSVLSRVLSPYSGPGRRRGFVNLCG